MTAGINANNNLNLLLFEVVGITRNPDTGTDSVFSVAVHPLVRVPAMIAYTSSSRTAVAQTLGGSQVNRAPRGFDKLRLGGTWGVESAGIFPYLGTGEVRAARFRREVVDMSDAIERHDVDDAIDILTGTPFLKLLLARYYADPDNTSFAINFYDLWDQRRFQAVIRSYQSTRQHRNGGASGLIAYQMEIEEVGPTVVGAPGTALIMALFDGLTTWANLNQAIETYNVQTLVNSAIALPAVLLGQLRETKDAVISQLDAVTGLLGGYSNSSNENLNAFLTNAKDLQDAGNQAVAAVEAMRNPTVDAPKGGIAWGSPAPDLASDAEAERALTSDAFQDTFLRAFDEADVLDGLEELVESAAFQQVAGKLFGYSREDYQRLLSGSRSGARPRIRGSQPYTVTDYDTQQSIEALFGVDFDRVLAWNNLTPDEALVSGVVLQIPIAATAASARRIQDLPVLGSHLGEAAWGVDLRVDLYAVDGRFQLVAGRDALAQGSDWLIEENQDAILLFANALPEVGRASALKAKVSDMLLSDRRIVSVDDIQIEAVDSSIAIVTTTTAINGGTVQTGSR